MLKMAFFKDVVLTDSIEIKKTPEIVFNFLTSIVDDDSYRAWHQKDHVSLRWLKGRPWAEGSVIYAEEYIHGKLHKLKFKITKIVPNKRIKYVKSKGRCWLSWLTFMWEKYDTSQNQTGRFRGPAACDWGGESKKVKFAMRWPTVRI